MSNYVLYDSLHDLYLSFIKNTVTWTNHTNYHTWFTDITITDLIKRIDVLSGYTAASSLSSNDYNKIYYNIGNNIINIGLEHIWFVQATGFGQVDFTVGTDYILPMIKCDNV